MRFLGSAAFAIAGVLLLAGCTDGNGSDVAAADEGELTLGHAHGLGTDPADGTLYVASHLGVFRVDDEGSASRVADRWQDTMAFTVAGPGRFLASGHPDLREDLPPHLGLIESTDAAETWRIVSLRGRADFHALEIAGDRVYGYDAITGRLLTTTDRTLWQQVTRAPLVDLAVNPTAHERVLASSPSGAVREYEVGSRRGVRLVGAPPAVLLDWPAGNLLVGVTADGQVLRSSDEGRTWTLTSEVSGTPQAIDIGEQAWYVATEEGIYVSADDGQTWRALLRPGG